MKSQKKPGLLPAARDWLWKILLSAIFCDLVFAPWNLWPFLWICLIPWFDALDQAPNLKKATLYGFWLCFFATAGGYFWVAPTLQEFGGVPLFAGILGLLIFSMAGQPQFLLLSPLFKLLLTSDRLGPQKGVSVRQSLLLPLVIALAYAGFDWALPKLFLDSLGQALYLAKNLRQVADLGSTASLTFLVVWVNFCLWRLLRSFRSLGIRSALHSPALAIQMALTVLLCSSAWLYGHHRLQEIQAIVSQSKTSVRAAAIQGNIGDFDKVAAERGVTGAARQVIGALTSLSDQALQQPHRPDFIVWPETSYPAVFRHARSGVEAEIQHEVESYSSTRNVPLLFGGYDHVNDNDFNSFFFLEPDGSLLTYHKSILLLFGEYIPGADLIPWIKEAFPQVGNFGRGRGPDVFPIRISKQSLPLQVTPMICYEALFTQFMVDSARRGSQLILNITNDSWFGTWGEPQVHLAVSTFRSIETRLPMLRTTNTGITALVQADGEISDRTEMGVPTFLNVEIPITDPIPTLVKQWGDWFGPFALGISLLGGLILLYPLLLRRYSVASVKSSDEIGLRSGPR